MTDQLLDIEQEMMFKKNEKINDRFLVCLILLSSIALAIPLVIYNMSAWFILIGSIIESFIVLYMENRINHKYPYQTQHLKP